MALQRKRVPPAGRVLVAESVPQVEPEQVEEAPAGPRVTVIVSAYNRAPALRRCLKALEASAERPSIEIIVMDNGSWDDTPEVEQEFPEVTFLRLPKYFGRTKALNIASRTAHAELLFFLSPDVEVTPPVVCTLAAKMEAEPETLAAACPLVVDAGGNQAPVFFRLPTRAALYRFWAGGSGLDLEAVDAAADIATVEYARFEAFMVTKYFVRGLNYLDERFGERWADAEVCWQIRRGAKKIAVLPQVKAVRHDPDEPESDRAGSARAVLASDCGVGAAAFVAKHDGYFAGLLFRLRLILTALGRTLTFQQPGYNFSLFTALLSGQKVDGTQTVAL
ncbi:MAG: glycosyltransferase [Bryobacteraceae bacterium]|jgi:GT2 family glycosyltransferase